MEPFSWQKFTMASFERPLCVMESLLLNKINEQINKFIVYDICTISGQGINLPEKHYQFFSFILDGFVSIEIIIIWSIILRPVSEKFVGNIWHSKSSHAKIWNGMVALAPFVLLLCHETMPKQKTFLYILLFIPFWANPKMMTIVFKLIPASSSFFPYF